MKSWLNENFPHVLGLVVAVGFLTLLGILCYHPVPEASHDVVMAMTGVLATAFGGIVGYQFGSSAGSKAKTEILAKTKE